MALNAPITGAHRRASPIADPSSPADALEEISMLLSNVPCGLDVIARFLDEMEQERTGAMAVYALSDLVRMVHAKLDAVHVQLTTAVEAGR